MPNFGNEGLTGGFLLFVYILPNSPYVIEHSRHDEDEKFHERTAGGHKGWRIERICAKNIATYLYLSISFTGQMIRHAEARERSSYKALRIQSGIGLLFASEPIVNLAVNVHGGAGS